MQVAEGDTATAGNDTAAGDACHERTMPHASALLIACLTAACAPIMHTMCADAEAAHEVSTAGAAAACRVCQREASTDSGATQNGTCYYSACAAFMQLHAAMKGGEATCPLTQSSNEASVPAAASVRAPSEHLALAVEWHLLRHIMVAVHEVRHQKSDADVWTQDDVLQVRALWQRCRAEHGDARARAHTHTRTHTHTHSVCAKCMYVSHVMQVCWSASGYYGMHLRADRVTAALETVLRVVILCCVPADEVSACVHHFKNVHESSLPSDAQPIQQLAHDAVRRGHVLEG
ncbi:hypothetical protein EON66_07835 [archaeon]|nr:MAG: hypothetical protein EON66_07835 [archaeon]